MKAIFNIINSSIPSKEQEKDMRLEIRRSLEIAEQERKRIFSNTPRKGEEKLSYKNR